MLLLDPPRKSIAERTAPIRIGDLAHLCRPRQWVKNLFLLAPLIFSGTFLQPGKLVLALLAFATFCCVSSAVYAINDLIDAPSDRHHPRKCRRPVASGRVSPLIAGLLALALLTVATVVALLGLPGKACLFQSAYVASSLLYCVRLKSHVVIDVMLIAVGFVLRLLAGSAAVSVEPSSWLLMCGFALAMVLGFGKRRLEVANLDRQTQYRRALANYSVEKLDSLLGINIAVCLLSYALYTVAPDTVAWHHTRDLVYSVPFVAYGLFRYLLKVQEGRGDDPMDVLLGDWVFLCNGLAWMTTVLAVLFFR